MARHRRDPRLDLTPDDLWALSAALTMALPHIPEDDHARYQALAAKLATIIVRLAQLYPG